MNIWDGQHQFSLTLRPACARHKSISQVCRDLGIHRQQFNKYLSGASFPSAYNLARICDYLEIDRFKSRPPARTEANGEDLVGGANLLMTGFLRRLDQANPGTRRNAERYVGYYHSYYMSPAFPGRVLKSISRIYERDGQYFDKTLERMRIAGQPAAQGSISRYVGDVIHTNDRLYVLHHTVGLHQTLSMVAFYPSYVATPRLLSGIFISVSSGPGRQPFASRVVYDYCGRRPDLRSMVAATGVYAVGDPAIPADILERIDNRLGQDETVLRALEY